MDQQTGKQINPVYYDVLANLLLLLHECFQQVNASLEIVNPVFLQQILNVGNSFTAVHPDIGEAAKNVNNGPAHLPVHFGLEDFLEQVGHPRFLDGLQVTVIDGQVPDGQQHSAQYLEFLDVGGRVRVLQVRLDGLDDVGVLHEQEWGLRVHTVQHQGVYCEVQLLLQTGLKPQDHTFYLGHGRVHFGSLHVRDRLIEIALVVLLGQLCAQGCGVHCTLPSVLVVVVDGGMRLVHAAETSHGFSGATGHQLRQVNIIVLAEIVPLLIAEQIFLVVVLEGEAGGGASRGQPKLVHNLLPHFIIGDRLASTFLADRAIEFVQVELLATDLGHFYLGDAFGGPVLLQVLLEPVCLLQLAQGQG